MTSPRSTTTSPAHASSPAARTFAPGFAGAENATVEPGLPSPASTATISYFTTASASSGSGAPVMMRTHSPGAMAPENTSPAPISAMTLSATGASSVAPAISSARRAKPSMAECAKGAMSMSLVRSAAATRPTTSSRGTSSDPSGATLASTSSRASSSEIMSVMGVPFRKKAPRRADPARRLVHRVAAIIPV